MKTKIIFSVLFISLITSCTLSQIGYSPLIDTTITKSTLQTLGLLNREVSGDTETVIGGLPYTIVSRNKNQPSNDKAAQFIFERFQGYGLTVQYMTFSATGQNVIGTRTGSKYPNRYYIICAHFDDMPSGVLAPGADDNGSGTCAVIEAARLLAPFTFDYTIKFIAFDEEEQGLVGSHRYVDTAIANGDSIMGVINLDMIAWDGDNDFEATLFCIAPNEIFTNYVKKAINLYVHDLVPYVIIQNMSGSDHYYFQQNGYKALCGIEMMEDFNPYYHTINDKFSNVALPYFLYFTRGAIAALMTFAGDYFMNIEHTPIVSANEYTPIIANAVITSPHSIAKIMNGPRLYYKVAPGGFSYVNAHYNNLDTFKFMIPDQPPGSTVYYYIAAQDEANKFVGTLPFGGKGVSPPGLIPPDTLFSYSVMVGTASNNNEPITFSLSQNYPNPFNPATVISFSLAKKSHVKLAVYDILGKEVNTIINDEMHAGEHTARFDGTYISSGIYFYSLFIDGVLFDTKKMTLMK